MDFKEIILEIKNEIAVLTLNRPDTRNVISSAPMIDEIVEALSALDRDESVKVLVLTGAGTAFSAGGNVKDMARREGMFAGTADEIAEKYRQGIQRIPRAFYGFNLPVIAAVNGPAIGAGCDLASMCDIRIASERASFGETFGLLGLVPGDGGAFFLQRIIGFSRASLLTYTCRIIDAKTAERMGLVSEVVPSAELLKRALSIAGEITRQPRRTLRMTKRLMQLSRERGLLDVLDLSAAFQGLCHHQPEHEKAVNRFLIKDKER